MERLMMVWIIVMALATVAVVVVAVQTISVSRHVRARAARRDMRVSITVSGVEIMHDVPVPVEDRYALLTLLDLELPATDDTKAMTA